MKPKAVLFDIEGTLIDMVDVYFKIINEVCQRFRLNGIEKETIRRLMSEQKTPWDYLVPEGERREKLIEQCRNLDKEIFYEIYLRETKPFPLAMETIEELVHRGIKVGLVSSGWGFEFQRFDWGRKMLRFVAVVITRGEVPVLKPAPDPVIECLRRLKVSPHDAVYVGDSPLDIKAGKAAGTMTIGVLSGASDYEALHRENPDMILPEVKDLLRIISI